MKNLAIAVLILCWSTAAFAAGSGSGKETSWGTLTATGALAKLPGVPGDVCSADDKDTGRFNQLFSPLKKELDKDIAARQRSLKKWQEKNSKKMMENVVDMPGFQGKSQDEMKKMTKKQRKELAEKMMQDKFGVSMADLKAQKNANKEKNVMANVDWAKSMAGEVQANDLMKSKEQREADKRKLKDTRKLLKEQAELTPQVLGLRSRYQAKVAELDKDPQGLGILKQIEHAEWELAEKQKNNEPCQALKTLQQLIVSMRRQYCSFYSSHYLKILNDYRVGIQVSLPKHDRLDQVASDLQQAQVGIPLSDAAIGLNGLESVQDYASFLNVVYKNNVGPENAMGGDSCGGDGEQGGT
ncbi:hypothetical protein OR1_00344 [Geobacter sp. OR-1]|uniref:hypothetical protein n=1 Tax=Geobacter sp. OR-1 TaxID=1266765 RepID=UPI0005420F95|nr:hypothetical protein [Geobacter sp. OR-1]GAM08074.1 hypothetical protein OR1_00344 [Geobacter sp. OR-1]